MQIPEIKNRLSILDLVHHYKLKPNKHDMIRCPFHDDSTPSLKLYKATNTYHCFGCGSHGDVIEFIQQKEHLNKHQALLKASHLAGEIKPSNPKPLKKQSPDTDTHTTILSHIFKYFQNGLNNGKSTKARQYLSSRGLWPLIGIPAGYNSGQFHHRGNLNQSDLQSCISAGLLIPYSGKTPNGKGSGYTPFAKDCIIFPLKNKHNEIVSLYGRSINNNSHSKHYYLKNRTGLYPSYPSGSRSQLILTESIIDAATLLYFPEITEHYEILACYGTNGLTHQHLKAITEWTQQAINNLSKSNNRNRLLSGVEVTELEETPQDTIIERSRDTRLLSGAEVTKPEIILFFDGDSAGYKATHKYVQELNQLLNPSNQGSLSGVEVTISYIDTPETEDINSLLQAYDSNIFLHLLNQRKASPHLLGGVHEPQSAGAQAGRLTTPNPDYKINFNNHQFITFASNNLQIIILGGINLQQLDRLRVTLKIHRTDTTNPLHSIRHSIDLYHSDYLEKLINKTSEQLEISTTILRKAIATLIEKVEEYRLSKIESQKEQTPKKRKLTEGRKTRAISYLRKSQLMYRTNQDIGKTGVVGENNNRLLMYLVFTSRLREQPLHIVSLGASGTGKTYLQEKIAELIPKNDKLEITILSENAFYYFEQTELKHKLVLIEDLDGAKEVLYPIRELQSKRWITKTIPIKDSKGNLKTISLRVEGPICLAGTTTREKLYEDNANRSLLIYLNTSPEHKELIMEYQRMLSAGKINRSKEQELKEFFKDMQTVLKPIKVRNPYAESLKLPEYIFKPLRTNTHYLSFIETVTFYHQYQREIKTDPKTKEQYIETTIEDIEWTNKLLKDILLAKSDELPKAVRNFFEHLKRWVKRENKDSFYAKEVQEYLRMYPMKVNRYIRELELRSFIRKSGGNNKSGFEYEVYRWDDYTKLQAGTDILDEILKQLRNKNNTRIT